jgi:HEPN domain-containing protein
MKRMPDHAELAQRYFNCAEANVERADRTINNNDRSYHVATAQQYLTLAEKELIAAQRRKRARRPGGSHKPKALR